MHSTYIWRVSLLLVASFFFATLSFADTQNLKAAPVIGKRTIKLVNRCPFPVWFGFISGATENRTGPACATDADCFEGSVCVDRGAAPKHCFWKNPVPASGNYKLAENGGTNSVDIPIYEGLANAFSGGVAGRTKCTAAGCETADCGAGEGGCPSGRGFEQPATQAEFTLQNRAIDYYDIEFINGMNIPIEMSPDFSKGFNPPKCTKQDCANPYSCGNPGAVNPITQVGRCSWTFTPPLLEYKWVVKGGASCTSDAECTAPNICGLSWNPDKTPRYQKTCGRLLGYWTANQICGNERNYGAPFNCNESLPAPQQNLTWWHMLACEAVPSCYQDGAPNTCCGCANWDKVGADVPPGPATEQCKNTNPIWVNGVQPKLLWLKKACPTSYSYQYDDMSSTFTCQRLENGLNTLGYVITFCPGGKTGGVTG